MSDLHRSSTLTLALTLALASTPSAQTPPANPHVALADVDGDGDLDLFLTASNQAPRLYRNNGQGQLALHAAAMPPAPLLARALTPFDCDGDGDVDLFLACQGQHRLYINRGDGHFTDESHRLPETTSPATAAAAGDLDADGDQDLILAGARNGEALYLNTGTGHFRAATDRIPTRNADTHAVILADIDGNGALDILCANEPTAAKRGGRDALYLNDGHARFTDASSTLMPSNPTGSRDLAAVDLDGDGHLDLLVAHSGTTGGRNTAHLFKDRFLLCSKQRLRADLDVSHAVAAGDVDGDGDADAIFANRGPNRLFLNDGAGRFRAATGSLPDDNGDTRDVALGDLDGDGDLDLVFATHAADLDILHNDGKGQFTPQPGPVASWTADTDSQPASSGPAGFSSVTLHPGALDAQFARTPLFHQLQKMRAGRTPAMRWCEIDGIRIELFDDDLIRIGETEAGAPLRSHIAVGQRLLELRLDDSGEVAHYRVCAVEMERCHIQDRYRGPGSVQSLVIENDEGQLFQVVRLDAAYVPRGQYRIHSAQIERNGAICHVDAGDMQPIAAGDKKTCWGKPIQMHAEWKLVGTMMSVDVALRGKLGERYGLPDGIGVQLLDEQGKLLRVALVQDGRVALSHADAQAIANIRVVLDSPVFGDQWERGGRP